VADIARRAVGLVDRPRGLRKQLDRKTLKVIARATCGRRQYSTQLLPVRPERQAALLERPEQFADNPHVGACAFHLGNDSALRFDAPLRIENALLRLPE